MQRFKCIEKYTDKHGNAISYILQNERGMTGEFNREMVKIMLRNPNIEFLNLKLTSDEKIIFTKEDNIVTHEAMEVDQSTLLALLINHLSSLKCAWANNFYADLNNNSGSNIIRNYLDTLKNGVNNENCLELTCRSNSVRLIGVYTHNGVDIGYRIKNKGTIPISYTACDYNISEEGKVVCTKSEMKNLGVNCEVSLNKYDAIKLISMIGFGGIWENTNLVCGTVNKPVTNVHEFIKYCFLNSANTKELKDSDKDKVLKSVGIEQINKKTEGFVHRFFGIK